MVDNATASKAKWVLNEVLSLNAQELGLVSGVLCSGCFLNEVLSLNAQELLTEELIALLKILNEVLSLNAQECERVRGDTAPVLSSMKS